MFAEYDSIVARSVSSGSENHISVVPANGDEAARPRKLRRSFVLAGSAAAAAFLVVLALVVMTDSRDTPATTDASVPGTQVTLPPTDDPAQPLIAASPPIALGDATYRTDEIVDGVTFSGADGLELVALRPGLVVMDSVSASGDLRGRVTVFEAEPASIADTLEAAEADGHLQVSAAQFAASDRSLRRQDLTVTADGVTALECEAQSGCLPLGVGGDEFDPSVWARSENFLVEAWPGDPSVFVLVQTRAFSDPLLSQAFEIIDSLRLG